MPLCDAGLGNCGTCKAGPRFWGWNKGYSPSRGILLIRVYKIMSISEIECQLGPEDSVASISRAECCISPGVSKTDGAQQE